MIQPSHLPSNSAMSPLLEQKDRIRQIAEDFESIFTSQMFNLMFKNISVDGLTKGGPSERIFRNMIITEFSKNISHSQSIGIADAVEEQLRSQTNRQASYLDAVGAYKTHQLRSFAQEEQRNLEFSF